MHGCSVADSRLSALDLEDEWLVMAETFGFWPGGIERSALIWRSSEDVSDVGSLFEEDEVSVAFEAFDAGAGCVECAEVEEDGELAVVSLTSSFL